MGTQDAACNPFYDELFKHWNVRLRPGIESIPIEVEDSDDESTDFGSYFAVKNDPYECADPGDGVVEVKVAKEASTTPVAAKAEQPSTTAVAPKVEQPSTTALVAEVECVEDSPEEPKADEFLAPPAMSQADIQSQILKLRFLAYCFTIAFSIVCPFW